ncbi:MAG: DUF1365 domain-containing protein [Thalassobaculales bacterium]
MNALYVGTVMHARLRPFRHAFAYRVYSVLWDIDTVPDCRLLSVNRFNLFSLHARDHGPRDGRPLRPWVEARLAEAGLQRYAASIHLLCFPRLLGYAFNPLSLFFCRDAEGRLGAVLYEVKNTFGEQHGYLVAVDPQAAGTLSHGVAKAFYVSPFLPMDCRYRMRLRPPGEDFALAIRQTGAEGPVLVARHAARRRPLGDAGLLRVFFSHPLLTLKVIAAIHAEALRLWLKGARLQPRVPAPARDVSISS